MLATIRQPMSIENKVEEKYIENMNLIDMPAFVCSPAVYVCVLVMQIQGNLINDRFHRQVTCGHGCSSLSLMAFLPGAALRSYLILVIRW